MQLSVDDGELRKALELLKTSIPEAAAEAGEAAAKEMAERLRDRIIKLIPDRGGWYDLYKDSIKVVEHAPDKYSVITTVKQISYGNIQAESSLLLISGKDEVSILLSSENPWTLDTLPAIDGGMECDLSVKPAGESEIETWRSHHLANRSKLTRRLEDMGINVLPFDSTLPKVNGKIIADVPFLALRLEYGLGGFPRTAVWTQANAEMAQIARSSDVQKAANNVFADRWFG